MTPTKRNSSGIIWSSIFLSLSIALSLSAEHNTLTTQEKAEGWQLLFDGKSTSGWRSYHKNTFPKNGWVIDNGMLHKQQGKRPGDIMTAERYENFEFSWEWRLLPGGNNGVKYMIIPERKATVGHEYQMIDDSKVKNADSSTASFYLIKAPRKDKPMKPMGSWNHSRIRVQGSQVEHWLNGMKVLEYQCGSSEVMERVPQTKFKKWPGFGEKVQGHILLTDHNDPCWFRNLKIRKLSTKD